MPSATHGSAVSAASTIIEVERRRLDVGDQAGADLPAEAGAVDPRAELVEPALVDLAVVDGEVEAAETGRRTPRRAAAAAQASDGERRVVERPAARDPGGQARP